MQNLDSPNILKIILCNFLRVFHNLKLIQFLISYSKWSNQSEVVLPVLQVKKILKNKTENILKNVQTPDTCQLMG